MKMFNRLLAFVLALMLCLPALAETAAEPTDVLATVNGDPITREEFDVYFANVQDLYQSQGYELAVEDLQKMTMQAVVQLKLMDQQIVAQGLALTDAEKAEVEAAALEDWKATIEAGLAAYGITETSTEDEKAAATIQVLTELETYYGYTEANYVEESVQYAGYDRLQSEMFKDLTVSDEEIEAYYNSLVASDEVSYKNDAAAYESMQQLNQMALQYGLSDYYTELYYQPEGYRSVTHILLIPDEALLTAYQDLQAAFEEQQSTLEEGGEVTETLVTEEEVENARLAILAAVQPTIDEINAKLAEGKSFAELIPLYTQDPGMSDDASVAAGYPVHMDSIAFDTVFRDAAFTVSKVGDITAPVVSSFGVHILQYAGDVPGGPVPLTDAMRAEFRAYLLENEQANVYNATLQAWEEAAVIEYSAEAQAFMADPVEEVPAEPEVPAE